MYLIPRPLCLILVLAGVQAMADLPGITVRFANSAAEDANRKAPYTFYIINNDATGYRVTITEEKKYLETNPHNEVAGWKISKGTTFQVDVPPSGEASGNGIYGASGFNVASVKDFEGTIRNQDPYAEVSQFSIMPKQVTLHRNSDGATLAAVTINAPGPCGLSITKGVITLVKNPCK